MSRHVVHAHARNYPAELSTRQAFDLIDAIGKVSKPVMVLSGGFRMEMATNGTLIDDRIAAQVADVGISRVAISLDGAVAATHDRFRNMAGSHAKALRGIRLLRDEGVSVQINSTIAKHNVDELPRMLDLALSLGADALQGCDEQAKSCPIDLKATYAPHYYRIRAQRPEEARNHGDYSEHFIAAGTRAKAAPQLLHGGGHGQHLSAMTRGCLVGTAVCFISNVGKVFPCGYLPVSAGDTQALPFSEIWNSSLVFEQLRNPDAYEGKCGVCRYESICGGCRTRAYAATGNVMSEGAVLPLPARW